jgi:hypothetical protein
MDNGIALRGVDILHPITFRAKHRDEVAFSPHGGDHDGGRAYAAGCATTNLDGGLEPGRQPEAGPPARQPVDPTAKARRVPVALKQAHQSAALPRIGLGVQRFLSSLPFY